ncbi:hypothetical protein J2S42_003302 [Catenuloplanes indicus]|uniref:Uncharacterized protein n=1 Tax=Catenuloplanes indicus TaxID=137267 RepID=A0AAE4B0A0_9ACTN|nr:hypothetical protein [Catenuloplanes indicus]
MKVVMLRPRGVPIMKRSALRVLGQPALIAWALATTRGRR